MSTRYFLLANILIASTLHAQTPDAPLFFKKELMDTAAKQSTMMAESASTQFCKNLRAQISGHYSCAESSTKLFQPAYSITHYLAKHQNDPSFSNNIQNNQVIDKKRELTETQGYSTSNNFWLDAYHHHYASQLALRLARESNPQKNPMGNHSPQNYTNYYNQYFLQRD